jgi:hypothetical protein
MCLEWSEEKFRLPAFALVAGWSLLRAVVRAAAKAAVDSNLQPKHKAWPTGKAQGQYKCKVHGKDPLHSFLRDAL